VFADTKYIGGRPWYLLISLRKRVTISAGQQHLLHPACVDFLQANKRHVSSSTPVLDIIESINTNARLFQRRSATATATAAVLLLVSSPGSHNTVKGE
jgi:hypothetical protein